MQNYKIDYQIHDDQLISAVVEVNWKEEHYLSKQEIDMLLAEWVHNNWRFIIDQKKHNLDFEY